MIRLSLIERKLQWLLPIASKSAILRLDSNDKFDQNFRYDIVILNREQKNFSNLNLQTLINNASRLLKFGGYLLIDSKNRKGLSFAAYKKILEQAGFVTIDIYGCLPNNKEPRYIVSLDDFLPFHFYLNVQSDDSRKIRMLKFLFRMRIGFYLIRQFLPDLSIVARKGEKNGNSA
ncbi:MAG: hypothetical protein ABH952_01715 [Candidatus Omnitrophota bacterium]